MKYMARTRGTRRANSARVRARRLRDVAADLVCSLRITAGGERCICRRCITSRRYERDFYPTTVRDLNENEWTNAGLEDYFAS